MIAYTATENQNKGHDLKELWAGYVSNGQKMMPGLVAKSSPPFQEPFTYRSFLLRASTISS